MSQKSPASIRATIKSYLSEKEEITFAYIFGSFVTGETFLDIDIAVYFDSKPDLMGLGRMQSEIQNIIPKIPVDLLSLNELTAKNPTLAHQVITKGELIINSDEECHLQFKKRTMQIYFDTAFLRRQMDEAFEKRLEKGTFGVRDYA